MRNFTAIARVRKYVPVFKMHPAFHAGDRIDLAGLTCPNFGKNPGQRCRVTPLLTRRVRIITDESLARSRKMLRVQLLPPERGDYSLSLFFVLFFPFLPFVSGVSQTGERACLIFQFTRSKISCRLPFSPPRSVGRPF